MENSGIRGRVKQLSGFPNQVGPIDIREQKLPAIPVRHFRIFANINIALGPSIWVPYHRNYTSIDGVIPDLSIVFQNTIGNKHAVKWQ
jgi:hypothetical protein